MPLPDDYAQTIHRGLCIEAGMTEAEAAAEAALLDLLGLLRAAGIGARARPYTLAISDMLWTGLGRRGLAAAVRAGFLRMQAEAEASTPKP
jgi:hypothetical protein